MKKIFFGLITIFLAACSARVTTKLIEALPPLDYEEEVVVLGLQDQVPASATVIGTVKVGDTGFSVNCGWDVVIEKAKEEARKSGGNVLKITKHTPPSVMGSTCDRITAQIINVENIQELNKLKSTNHPAIDKSWDYAKLYVYRPKGPGLLINYDVHLGDSVIWRAKNNTKQEIWITQKGLNVLWAKTEATSDVPITIEHGRKYYLRCTVEMGIVVGRPQLQLVDRSIGEIEFNSINDN